MTMWYHLPTIFNRRYALPFVGLISLIVAIITATFLTIAPAQAASNHTLAFQGRLLMSNGSAVPDGHYNIQFNLYQGGTGTAAGDPGGSLKWTENYVNNNASTGVSVKNSYFSVNLGSNTALPSTIDWSSTALWLSINVGGSAADCTTFGGSTCVGDGEMVPMTQVTASPYSLDSGKLGGKTSDQYTQLGQGTQTDNSSNSSISINKTGSGNLIQLQNNGADALTVDGSGNITLGNNTNDHSIALAPSNSGADGGTLTLAAGDGGGGTGSTGGTLALKGGDGGGTNGNGGTLTLNGGAGTGTGVSGLVMINTPAFVTSSDDGCYTTGGTVASSCTFTSTSLNNNAVLMAGFSTAGQTATLPDPAITTAGRLIYITVSNDSQDFNLSINGGTTVALVANATQALLWNGSDWTAVGSQSAVTPMMQPAMQTQPLSSPLTTQTTTAPSTNSVATQVNSTATAPSDAPSGSIYYDTTKGELRCYENNTWGACSASPDSFVSLSPSYAGAVVHGDGNGTMTTDMCSGPLAINDGSNEQPDICGTKDTYNYYNWTSSETSAQTRSIFVTYKLPDNFKQFVDGSTALAGFTDSDDAKLSYRLYRQDADGLTACDLDTIVSTGIVGGWTNKKPDTSGDPSKCAFKAGDSLVVRITMTAANDANAYASTLNFAYHTEQD